MRKLHKKMLVLPLKRIFIYIMSIIVILFFVFPLFWQISSSLKPPGELYKMPLVWVPTKPYFLRYLNVLRGTPILSGLRNSFIVAFITTIINLFLGSLCAYSISRIRIPGRRVIMRLILILSLLPGITILVPMYQVMVSLRLLNTYAALIIIYTGTSLPFAVWFLVNYFKTIPDELEDAALIDGCTYTQVLYRIFFPIAKPAMASIGLLCFIGCWNEYLFAVVFTQTEAMRTAPVILDLLQGLHDVPWGDLTTAATIMTLPIVILVLLCQKFIVGGLTTGAVKG